MRSTARVDHAGHVTLHLPRSYPAGSVGRCDTPTTSRRSESPTAFPLRLREDVALAYDGELPGHYPAFLQVQPTANAALQLRLILV